MEEELDFRKLKYVLYARKSTEDETRQIRSIEDQIEECKTLANRLGLHIVHPFIREEKSAKKPNQRRHFRQMINDIKKGKYDAILAWNPDRLARNMLEGGEIIDLVDQGIIKDLKFVTHHFTKDANGKMLLGMAFVLSKQYSDKLSQDVTRGVRRNFGEGKAPTPKHGYYRDKDGLYRPNENTFELIKSIWEQRANGTSYEKIVNFLEDNKYIRQTKTGKSIKMTKQTLTDLFKDPFYYGILLNKTTGERVDLREIYNFHPAITEETYNSVQQLDYRKIHPNKDNKTAFYPLKMMIICSFCGSNRYVGPSTGRYERYLNARCGNKFCLQSGKSIRMKKVFDFIYEFLKEGLNFTEKEYNQYYNNLSIVTERKKEKVRLDIHSMEGILKKTKTELNEVSYGIIKLDKGSESWNINETKINKLANEKEAIEKKLKELKEKVSNPTDDKLSLEEFLNLSKNAAVVVQSANSAIKDLICKKIFLNLTVDNEKVLSYQAKEPFATLLKQRQLLLSRGERT